jgi:hypothetical protein
MAGDANTDTSVVVVAVIFMVDSCCIPVDTESELV